MSTIAIDSSYQVRAADAIWIVFVLVQALDGALTIIGMATMGLGIEANPLVSWYAHAFGPATGVMAAKLFAVGCGIIVYTLRYHKTLGALAGVYLFAAVGPWLHVLSIPQ